MTFIAAGTALATSIGLTSAAAITAGTIGSSLAVAAGTGVAAGAAGAALGATGAAITGGDVGQGALMGGVGGAVTGGLASGLGGLAGAGASTAANVGVGAAAGAAGGAAGSAAAGQDVGKGALMGGAMGGIGGYLKGAAPAAEGVGETVPASAKDITTATGGATMRDTAPIGSLMKDSGGLGPTNLSATDVSNTLSTPVMTNSSGSLGTISGRELGSGVVNTAAATPPPPSAFEKGLASIKDLNGMDVAKTAAPGLISGAINGGGFDTPAPYVKPRTPLGRPAKMSKDYKPYFANPMDFYADGGAVGAMQSQQPMNKFAQMGLEMAQQQQPAQQANQQAAQQLAPQAPQAAPQGIAQIAPQATSAPATGIGYAKGGLLNDLPGSDIMKSAYDSSIGNVIAPSLSDKMFGEDKPDEVAKPTEQSDFMKQVQAGVQQQMQQQQGVQLQPQPQAQPYYQPQMHANGGLTGDNLGDYSHGGIAGLTSAVGSGVSDSIPAQIGDSGKQPARLAANEFVVPARAVSELGQGSSEAGAKQLQAMVDRIQAGRKKSIGKGKIAVDSKATKNLPA